MAENKLSALNILQWNANGITNNTEELKLVLAEKNIDIALISPPVQNLKFSDTTASKPITPMTQLMLVPHY